MHRLHRRQPCSRRKVVRLVIVLTSVLSPPPSTLPPLWALPTGCVACRNRCAAGANSPRTSLPDRSLQPAHLSKAPLPTGAHRTTGRIWRAPRIRFRRICRCHGQGGRSRCCEMYQVFGSHLPIAPSSGHPRPDGECRRRHRRCAAVTERRSKLLTACD